MAPQVSTPRTTRNSRGLRRSPSVSSVESNDDRTATGRVPKRRSSRRTQSATANANALEITAADNQSSAYNPDADFEESSTSQTTNNESVLPTIEEEDNFATPQRTPVAHFADNQEAAVHTPVANHGQAQRDTPRFQFTTPTPSSRATRNERPPIVIPKAIARLLHPYSETAEAYVLRTRERARRDYYATKPPFVETKEFQDRRSTVGAHRFARELYQAIRNDHYMRKCECGLPKVYKSRSEAIRGQGHLRFYIVNSNPNNLRVLQEKSDICWHCQCEKPAELPDLYKQHIDGTLKRKATDFGYDILASNNEIAEAAALRGGGRRVRRRIEREATPEERGEPMFAHVVGRVKDMGMSFFKYLGSFLPGASTPAPTPEIEEPQQDVPKEHLVVRRFKLQHCLSQDSSEDSEPQVNLGKIDGFAWTSDPARYIGKEILQNISLTFESHVLGIHGTKVTGGAEWKTVQMKLKRHHDPMLCYIVHEFISDHLGPFSDHDPPEERHDKWAQGLMMYEQSITFILGFINDMYLHPKPFWQVRNAMPRPEIPLTLGNYEMRSQWKKVGELILWFAQKRNDFNTTPDMAEALAKMVADAKAVHKQEPVPSWIQFPGHNMGGALSEQALPAELIYDEIPIDDMVIEPVYALKFPPSEAAIKKVQAHEPDKALIWNTPKPVLKTTSKLPISVKSPAKYVPTPEKKRKLAFQEPVAAFAPPTKVPTKVLTREDKLPKDEQELQLRYHGSNYNDLLDGLRNNVETRRKDMAAGTLEPEFWWQRPIGPQIDAINDLWGTDGSEARDTSRKPTIVKPRERQHDVQPQAELTPKELRRKTDEKMRALFERKKEYSRRLAALRENPILSPETKRKAMNAVPEDPSTPEDRRRYLYGEDEAEDSPFVPRSGYLFAKPARVVSKDLDTLFQDMLKDGTLTPSLGFRELSKRIKLRADVTPTQRLEVANLLRATAMSQTESRMSLLKAVDRWLDIRAKKTKKNNKKSKIAEARKKIDAEKARLATATEDQKPEIEKKLETANVELVAARRENLDAILIDDDDEDDGETLNSALSGFLQDPRVDDNRLKIAIAAKKKEELSVRTQVRAEFVADLARKVEQEEEERKRREKEKLRLRAAAEEAEKKRLREEKEEQERKAREAALPRGLRMPKRRLIPPVGDDWTPKLESMAMLPKEQVVTETIRGGKIYARNLWETLLLPQSWLSDTVICYTLEWAVKSIRAMKGETDREAPKTIMLTQDFWNLLVATGKGPASCARMASRNKITPERFFDIEVIVIPIVKGAHWTLAVVRPHDKIITHMDSMKRGGSHKEVLDWIQKWIQFVLGAAFVEEEWKIGDHYRAPCQNNAYDCGVFTICNAICAMLGVAMEEAYAAKELVGARRWIAAVLLNRGFEGELSLDGV
ncbi:hypothetical protein OQA88_12245 [Cercophora sp. LCS_1]